MGEHHQGLCAGPRVCTLSAKALSSCDQDCSAASVMGMFRWEQGEDTQFFPVWLFLICHRVSHNFDVLAQAIFWVHESAK